jgi:hypothetical protein
MTARKRKGRTGRTGQAEQDRQNRTGRVGQAEQDRHHKSGRTGKGRTGQAQLDRQGCIDNWTSSQDRAARIRQPGRGNQKKTERRGQLEQDTRTGKAKKHRQNKTAMTGLPGQDSTARTE